MASLLPTKSGTRQCCSQHCENQRRKDNVAKTTVLQVGIPSSVVGHEEGVIVRSLLVGFDNRVINFNLRLVHGLGEVNGEVDVTAASAVTRAVVGAYGTLARTTFVPGEAGALSPM